MDRIQLIVNRVQVTKHSDVNKLQLYIYPISVNQLSLLNIKIGKVSFSQCFCLSYRCNVLLTFILEVMKNSGFSVPQMDYRLIVNGQPVDMKERLEDVGCVENSEVVVEAENGDSLDDVFFVGNSSAKEAPSGSSAMEQSSMESEVQGSVKELSAKQSLPESTTEQPVAKPEAKSPNDPVVVTRRLDAPIMEARPSMGSNETGLSMESSTDIRQSADSMKEASSHQNVMDDAFVSSRQPRQRRVTDSSAEDPQSPMKEESKQMEIPSAVKTALKELSAGLAEDSVEYRRVATLQEFIEGSMKQLSEMYSEYLRMKELVDQIHYENQMLREMVNETTPNSEAASEREKAERLSWRRVSSDRASGESLSKELPDDPEALKKLVNEKYATALMNERRYLKEKKRCQKYRLIAEAAGMDEKSVDGVYMQLHEVLEHRDQLKESNLNLKEAERALQQEIDARDDEIHRLRMTVQARDESIGQLADQIKEYDALLRESTSKEDAALPMEVQKSAADGCSDVPAKPMSKIVEKSSPELVPDLKPTETVSDNKPMETVPDNKSVETETPPNGTQPLQECEAEWRERVASLERELQEVREQLEREKKTDVREEKEKLEEECASLKKENEYLTSELREMIGGEEEEESVVTQLNGLIQVLMEKQTVRKERASTIFGNSI